MRKMCEALSKLTSLAGKRKGPNGVVTAGCSGIGGEKKPAAIGCFAVLDVGFDAEHRHPRLPIVARLTADQQS